jgi:hypothetical protein
MIVLIIQKDTFQNNKVKSILKTTTLTTEELLTNLQEEHCIEFQLIAHTENSPVLVDKLIQLTTNYKTKFGKDWYEFDGEILSKIIFKFLENGNTYLNLNSISSTFGFSLDIFPVISKEVKIQNILESKIESKISNKEIKPKKEKEEFEDILENLQEMDKIDKSEKPRKNKKKN